jgi:hypothetical protein
LVGSSARGDGSVPIPEERDDRSEPRAARFQRAHQEHFLRFEENIGHVVRVAVDAETVAQPGIHRADGADHGTPERRRDQAKGPKPAFLDEIDEHIRLADAKPRARDSLATKGSLTLDASDFQTRPLQRTRLGTSGCSVH